jgi:hypothetical protein
VYLRRERDAGLAVPRHPVRRPLNTLGMVLRAGFKKQLRLYVELKNYDKNRRKITGPQCVKVGTHL